MTISSFLPSINYCITKVLEEPISTTNPANDKVVSIVAHNVLDQGFYFTRLPVGVRQKIISLLPSYTQQAFRLDKLTNSDVLFVVHNENFRQIRVFKDSLIELLKEMLPHIPALINQNIACDVTTLRNPTKYLYEERTRLLGILEGVNGTELEQVQIEFLGKMMPPTFRNFFYLALIQNKQSQSKVVKVVQNLFCEGEEYHACVYASKYGIEPREKYLVYKNFLNSLGTETITRKVIDNETYNSIEAFCTSLPELDGFGKKRFFLAETHVMIAVLHYSKGKVVLGEKAIDKLAALLDQKSTGLNETPSPLSSTLFHRVLKEFAMNARRGMYDAGLANLSECAFAMAELLFNKLMSVSQKIESKLEKAKVIASLYIELGWFYFWPNFDERFATTIVAAMEVLDTFEDELQKAQLLTNVLYALFVDRPRVAFTTAMTSRPGIAGIEKIVLSLEQVITTFKNPQLQRELFHTCIVNFIKIPELFQIYGFKFFYKYVQVLEKMDSETKIQGIHSMGALFSINNVNTDIECKWATELPDCDTKFILLCHLANKIQEQENAPLDEWVSKIRNPTLKNWAKNIR